MYESLNLVHDIFNVNHCKCRFRNVSPTCCLRLDEMGKAACEIRIVEIGDMYSFIFKVNCVRRFDTFQHQCILIFCHFNVKMLCCYLTVVFIHLCLSQGHLLGIVICHVYKFSIMLFKKEEYLL